VNPSSPRPGRAGLDGGGVPALLAIVHDEHSAAADRSAAEAQLVQAFRGLSRGIANRYANGRVERDDLYAVADAGLLAAIRRFDPAKGASFPTFATVTIAGGIKRHFRDSTWSLGVPRRIRDLSVRLRSAEASLEQRTGCKPTAQQLAAELEVPLDDVVEALGATGAYATSSIDAGATVDGGGEWSEADRLQAEEVGYAVVEHRELLRPALDSLSERERLIVIATFFRHQSQTQIAEQLGVSQVHVSRLLRKALERLRASLTEPAEPPTA